MESGVSIIRSKLLDVYKLIVSRDLLLAICVTLAFIVAGTVLGQENNKIIPVSTLSLAHYHQEPHNALSFMSNWDGPNYIKLSQDGYTNPNQTNFFPFYPIAIHMVNIVIDSALDSALIVAWISCIGAIYFYLKVIKLLFKVHDNLEAFKGVLLFILFPTSVFLIATYTESLFAFLALGAIYYALQKKYLPTALFSMFATATHFNGVFLLLLIGLMLLEEKVKLTKIFITLLIGSLGLVSYMLFLLVHFHTPLAFVTAQQQHGWLQYNYPNLFAEFNIITISIILLIIASVIYWWGKRKSFSVYSLLYLCIPFVGGQIGGFNRYSLMIFPIQFMLYERFRNNTLAYSVTIAIFSVFCAHYLFQYAGGYVGG